MRELSLVFSFRITCAIWSGLSSSPLANGPEGLRRIFLMSGPKMVADDDLPQLLVAGMEGVQIVVVEEMAEGPMADVVDKRGDPEKFFHIVWRRARRAPLSWRKGYRCRANRPATCMVPREWTKRVCSAEGYTQRALCS